MQLFLRLLPGFWNRLVSTVSSNRTDRTTPSGMHALPFSFITSCVKNQFESCSFLKHFARNHILFTVFFAPFCTEKEISYTRKSNPTPYPTPETASKHWIFVVWV